MCTTMTGFVFCIAHSYPDDRNRTNPVFHKNLKIKGIIFVKTIQMNEQECIFLRTFAD